MSHLFPLMSSNVMLWFMILIDCSFLFMRDVIFDFHLFHWAIMIDVIFLFCLCGCVCVFDLLMQWFFVVYMQFYEKCHIMRKWMKIHKMDEKKICQLPHHFNSRSISQLHYYDNSKSKTNQPLPQMFSPSNKLSMNVKTRPKIPKIIHTMSENGCRNGFWIVAE